MARLKVLVQLIVLCILTIGFINFLIAFHIGMLSNVQTVDADLDTRPEEIGRSLTSQINETGISIQQKPKPKTAPLPIKPVFQNNEVISNLWPYKDNHGDRILDQLAFVLPPNSTLTKVILSYSSKLKSEDIGQGKFIADECPVSNCELIDKRYERNIDAVVFNGAPSRKMLHQWGRDKNIVKIWYELESPLNRPPTHSLDHKVNWTATYRRDATIVTPYEKFVLFDEEKKLNVSNINHAAKKTKMVAWFVSNCRDKNGRLQYALELGRHLQVDIYGACGNFSCPRKESKHCYGMLNKDYKFYLSFENSACKDYITEKLFWNGLQNEIIPVVMGAHPDDYAAIAPPHSFIHVDQFDSPESLAKYLLKLDSDDELYNEYFKWKTTGSFINTKFWCRVCALLHAQDTQGVRTWYPSAQAWATVTETGPVCLPTPGNGRLWSSWRQTPKYNHTSDLKF